MAALEPISVIYALWIIMATQLFFLSKTFSCNSNGALKTTSPTISTFQMRDTLADFECYCAGWKEKDHVWEVESWQRLCRIISNDRLCLNSWRQLLSEQVSPQNAEHRPCGSPPPFGVKPVWQARSRVFLKDVTTGAPANNTWMYWVKVHVRVCVCRWTRYCGGCECLCDGHKRKVNTAHASLVVTPVATISHSSSLAAETHLLVLCCWILTKQRSKTLTLSSRFHSWLNVFKKKLKKRLLSPSLSYQTPKRYLQNWLNTRPRIKTWLRQQPPGKHAS